jgi:hypothetical protein
MQAVSVALSFAFALVVWLKTNAFAEYMRLLGIKKFFRMEEYLRLHDEGYGGSYIDFLIEYYNDSFLVRLFSCPVCLSFWMGVISSSWLGWSSGLVVPPLILFFYLIFNKLL